MRKVFNSTLVSCFLLFCEFSVAQQVQPYKHYYINPFIYNPAYTGYSERGSLYLMHQSQWTSIENGPQSSIITFDGSTKNKHIGLGISIFNDVIGITTRTGGYGHYSHRVNFSKDVNLRFGIALGAVSSKLSFSEIIVEDPNDPFFQNNAEKMMGFDGNVGLLLVAKNFELGLSAPQILPASLQYANTDKEPFYNLTRHYLASAKYNFILNEEKKISFCPLILVRVAEKAPIQYDVSAVLDFKKIGWLAATYKSDYAINLNAGARIKNRFVVGFAYDLIISPISSEAGLSFEALVGYTFGAAKMEKQEKAKKRKEELAKKKEAAKVVPPPPPPVVVDTPKVEPPPVVVEPPPVVEPEPEPIKETPKEYYLIIGSFVNKAFADKQMKKYMKAHPSCKMKYNESNQMYHIYVSKPATKEQALEELNKIREEFPDAWVQTVELKE